MSIAFSAAAIAAVWLVKPCKGERCGRSEICLLIIQCYDDQDAVRSASATMPSRYAGLEISLGNKVVWRGSRERANVWASSSPGRPLTVRKIAVPRDPYGYGKEVG